MFGAYLIGISLLAVISPDTFFENVGPFGPKNEHYTRDGAVFELAFGIGAVVAVWRASWAKPMLAVLTLQSLFHAINHLVDINEADPKWLGTFDFVGLALSTLVLGWAYWRLRNKREVGP